LHAPPCQRYPRHGAISSEQSWQAFPSRLLDVHRQLDFHGFRREARAIAARLVT
jgi:hypothetical protein